MKKFVLWLASFGLLLGAIPVKAQDKKQIMTTFYPVYFLAERIAGDAADVSMLLDGGQDAHSYEASAQDSVKIQESDLFIYQDDEMEYFVADIMNLIDQEATKVLESTVGLELLAGGQGHDHEGEEGHDHEGEEGHDHEGEESHDHEGEEGHDHEGEEGHDHEGEEAHDHEGEEDAHDHAHEYDPHTWLDPIFYSKQAENIKNALIELDPDNQETYEANAQALITELEELDALYKEELADLENRTIVVQHQAFGYLAHAYDLNQVAITGLQTNQEPSAQVLAQMQDFVKENDAKVIYVDPAMSTSISETVASATNAELRPLRTLEVVTSEEREAGIDYFTIMKENLDQLLK